VGATNSQFYVNAVKAFIAKVAGATVFAEDLNEATDEIEAIEQILGTGLRTRSGVSWATGTTTWSTLTARLNNMDSGIRTTDAAIHPQYATVAATSLQPADTATVGLTVTGRSGSTQPVGKFVGADGTTIPLQINNTTVALRTPTITAVAEVINADTGYTGDVLQVFKGAVKTFSVTATGAATFTDLVLSGQATIPDFTNSTHDHTSPAEGGRIFPAGMIIMYGAPSGSLPTGWLLCNGQAVSRATYSELFSAVGTAYGSGDGSSTFNLPSLTSRFPRGSSTTTPGATGGSDTVTLSSGNLPAHTHTMNHDHGAITSGGASDTSVNFNMTTGKEAGNELSGTSVQFLTDGTGGGVGGAALSGTLAHTHVVNLPTYSGSTGSAGSGSAVTVTNPYVTVHYLIKV
jgi:microcystin-dependent protein